MNDNVLDIGMTPLYDLSSLVETGGARLFGKCEFMNPGMSLKDRIAKHMIEEAIKHGALNFGDTIVCASSGNTGCSVAAYGGSMGFQVIVVTTNKCSEEKLSHIEAYGARVIIESDANYMNVANELAEKFGYFNIDQYSNPNNPRAYYNTLGPEIWDQTNGEVTHFVMTGSTFGCISGTSKYLKEKNPSVYSMLADPKGSNMHKYYYQAYKGNKPGLELGKISNFIIEGAGKSKPTSNLDCSLIDEVYSVNDQDSIETCHKVAKEKGLLLGGSSGLNIYAAVQLANRLGPDDMVVTILCDNGVKYLSKIYNSEYLNDNNVFSRAV